MATGLSPQTKAFIIASVDDFENEDFQKSYKISD